MSKISDFIDTLDVPVDGSYRCNCPICYGKNTFTVTNDRGNILYNCYKNSCGTAGSHHANLDAFTIKALLSSQANENTSEAYREALQQTFDVPPYLTHVSDEHHAVRKFLHNWSLDPTDLMYDIRQHRIVFPVMHHGVMLDAVGRSLDGRHPKWLRYASSPVPYMYGHGDVMVIVEDAISAYTVGTMFEQAVGVALLGTQLTPFHKWYFSTYYKHNRFVIALDPDALTKTMSIVKELRANIPDVVGVNLRDDLKYREDVDIDKLTEMLNA